MPKASPKKPVKKASAPAKKTAAVSATADKKSSVGITKREYKKFQELLLAERDRLVGSIRSIEDASRHESGRDHSGDLTSYAETGTDNFELETALNIASGESEWLKDVTEALQRIKEGSYGICEECEKEIPKKRLEVFPSAKYCVACKEKMEKQQAY